jgi:hypothetical protein
MSNSEWMLTPKEILQKLPTPDDKCGRCNCGVCNKIANAQAFKLLQYQISRTQIILSAGGTCENEIIYKHELEAMLKQIQGEGK